MKTRPIALVTDAEIARHACEDAMPAPLHNRGRCRILTPTATAMLDHNVAIDGSYKGA